MKRLIKVLNCSLNDMAWESGKNRRLQWTAKLWKADPHHTQFLFQACLLLSPSNLFSSGFVESTSLPPEPEGTLEHILSSCPKIPGKECYYWLHDQVLKAIRHTFSCVIWPLQVPLPRDGFVWAGDNSIRLGV